MNAAATKTTPQIAVIGGGAAGLAAARILAREAPFVRVKVFEQQASLGGVWNYQNGEESSEESSSSSNNMKKSNPMYQGLRTNLPKELMQFREFPWTADLVKNESNNRKKGKDDNNNDDDKTALSTPSYMTHSQVLHYLQKYAEHFQLSIQYGTTVQQVQPLSGTTSVFRPNAASEEDWPQFRVDYTTTTTTTTADTTDAKPISETFDGVCVCNGHYNRPSIPRIPGVDDFFKGTTMHSIAYDRPQDFQDQIVLCIGGRASGADIARELVPYAKHVYLSDTTCTTTMARHSKVTWVPETTCVLPDGSIQFGGKDNKSTTAPHVDTIVYCTGYDYEFPFLKQATTTTNLIETSQRRVQPLLEQFWHARYPHLAFIGLPHSVVPFPLFEVQMEAYAQQIITRNQQFTLPPLGKRLELAEQDATSGGPQPHGRVPQDTHYLGSAQWDYCRKMGEYGGVADGAFLQYMITNEKIYNHAGASRKADGPGSPDAYRSNCYERLEEGFRTLVMGQEEEKSAAVKATSQVQE